MRRRVRPPQPALQTGLYGLSVSLVNKSAGPFDALLCVGHFFPDLPERVDEFNEFIEGRSQIPLPTYFIGDFGVGLSVAYLSGRHSSDAQQFGVYSQDDVDELRAIAEEPGIVDIFLTYPCAVFLLVTIFSISILVFFFFFFLAETTIAELVAEIKPCYHIAGSKGVYYAREPYSNIDAVHTTHFLGLVSVGNKEKQDSQQTVHAEAAERSNASVSDSQYWRYDVSQKRQKHGAGDGHKLCFKHVSSGSCPRGEKCHFQHDMDARDQYLKGVCFDFINKGKCERGPDCNFKHSFQKEGDTFSTRRRLSENATNNRSKECWFCLSSPNVESHLIISVGENIYCALAKGPLVQDHVLVIPVEHLSNTFSLPPECEIDLVDNYSAGRNYLRTQFDRNFSFFYVELPDGAILSHLVEENEIFPAQFGREVLAGLLNMADRADWRSCTCRKKEETKMAEDFKSQFREFDPNK
ncbi:hypothetical protein FEM48_Zijuj08G0011400 [Ziziphus jujuba var. spinosa]|uniref:C3H1-type domain-containing protein n=1 Tax=Ziziphus jujuba var. spinosa TaxID=714518 RepID=A0A978UW43_ZIZJJ|nr:hypothetical protein FEM48_Zijuj08G0011400 [Ziziphus jujuba var. spinosa]